MEIKQAVIALTAWPRNPACACSDCWSRRAEAGMPAGEIAERLDIPPATLTFHLKELSHAGLVESRREGRSIIYSLRCDGMSQLLTFLATRLLQRAAGIVWWPVC